MVGSAFYFFEKVFFWDTLVLRDIVSLKCFAMVSRSPSGCGGHVVDRRVYCGFLDGKIAGHRLQMNGPPLHWGSEPAQSAQVRSCWSSYPQKQASQS